MRRRRRHQAPRLRIERGIYRLGYRDKDGRKRTQTFGKVKEVTRAEAGRQCAAFLAKLNNDIVKGLCTDRTVGHMLDQWKASELPSIDRPGTRKMYLWVINKMQNLQDAPLAVIMKPDLQRWINSLALAPASLGVVRAITSSIFEAARDWGWIEINPVSGRFRLPTRPEQKKQIMLPAHVKLVIGELGPEARTAFLLAVLSGLRKGEMEALEWADVKLPWIHVTKTLNCKREPGPPKSRKSNRSVEVGPLLGDALEHWRALCRGSRLVFPPARGGAHRFLDNLLHGDILPVVYRHGLPRITWHTLRHTYNTWGHFAGIDPTTMRDLMGHSSVVINQDVYLHSQQMRPLGAARKIEGLLEPDSGTLNLEDIDTTGFTEQ